jgi:hypothetical protein
MRRELFACYWLLALGFLWRSTIYTFSVVLYAEAALAPRAPMLLGLAAEVRERHNEEDRTVSPERRPRLTEVEALGPKGNDATHVADAIGMGAHVLLTHDRDLRKRSPAIESRWRLRVQRPSDFLQEAVSAGAPWPVATPWPWEVIERFASRGCP